MAPAFLKKYKIGREKGGNHGTLYDNADQLTDGPISEATPVGWGLFNVAITCSKKYIATNLKVSSLSKFGHGSRQGTRRHLPAIGGMPPSLPSGLSGTCIGRPRFFVPKFAERVPGCNAQTHSSPAMLDWWATTRACMNGTPSAFQRHFMLRNSRSSEFSSIALHIHQIPNVRDALKPTN
jgi:hypothetical protein